MVSRRNLFAIWLTMLILFFMFQFTGVVKSALNEYSVNEYEETAAAQLSAASMYCAVPGADDPMDASMGERPFILFVGDDGSGDIREVVQWWCTYTKRGLRECRALSECDFSGVELPAAAVIDGESIDLVKALPVLKEMAEAGIHLIFARLPAAGVLLEHPDFCEFIGIREVHRLRVELSGIHLFDGFLLGGERIYESRPGEEERMDLELTVPWYMTGTGTKTYIMGLLEDQGEYKNEMLPAILWRKSTGNAKVFCVNADYLTHMYGIGFLNAMMADTDVYEIYPVVNARNLSVVNFAGFADENGDEMEKLYSQPLTAVYRELIWPTLVSVSYRSSSKITLFAASQLDYGDAAGPDAGRLTYYMKLLREEHGEMGISASPLPGISAAERLKWDLPFYREGAGSYAVLSLYLGEDKAVWESGGRSLFPEVRTVTAVPQGEEPMVSYLDESTTLQNMTHEAERHTYSDDLALMGVQTALGYSNTVLDLNKVSDPPSSDYYWEKLSRALAQNIVTYWRNYRCFDGTTLAESDERVRRFLALDYRVIEEEDRITVRTNGAEGPVWFLLKVNGRTVKQARGASFEALKGGYYLIELEGQSAVIELAEKRVLIHD